MIYLLILPALIILYCIYFAIMIFKAVRTPLYYPGLNTFAAPEIKVVTYSNNDGFPFTARIMRPEGIKEKLPCVILVHGEIPDFIKPKPADWRLFSDYGKLLADRGFASVIFNHRSTRNLRSVGTAREDLKKLLAFLVEKEDELAIDNTKLFLWAYSGGVTIGLNWILKEKPDSVKAFISYYGALKGKEENESAVELLSKSDGMDLPPIQIVKAEKDMIRSSRKEAEDLYITGKGKTAIEILRHPGPHGFDCFSKTDETVEIIDKTIEFIKTNL
jgi:predicted esterase